ncbi:cell wall hydrolase [Sedimentibacter hydroxybenzoicus DSM 7310]|uniref:Cell wall hydrolase n=1 Tax=Sedimentibacter hydroxybenzoicus DSM 7310 TaxID=1123245 RepID=A0A974BM22_SEDHY|nr:cell wall hydrolase [Sedimentibacter hydroxybenzoicus]NYB75463.1 cell wall hydrolase [Sedimentibacter hydroxybenzoicus DSM 7310]
MNKKIRSILLSAGLAAGLTFSFTATAEAATYTVVKGDTLYLISQKYNISLSSLRQANNIYTDYIGIGQILNIPVKTSSPIVETEKNELWQNYSADELDLLSRLIMAETESQPYQAKVAVGAVVLNRVESGVFASTITEVINQKFGEYYQFSPVQNGWIKRSANEECIKAAKEALNGVDPTNGALFFYDDSTTNTWILSKPVSVKIGRMIYSY